MVLAHVVDAWTRDADRDREAFHSVMFLGGLAAPAFLFLAGLGSALSGAAQLGRGASRAQVRRALLHRGLAIFGLAFAFRLQAFILGLGSVIDLLRVDILNVMGLSLMFGALLWGAVDGARGRIILAVAATLALAMAAPLARTAGWVDALPVAVQWYLRPSPFYTTFTLLPWAGFVSAGLAAGVALTTAREARAERRLHVGLATLAAAGIAVAYWAALQPSIYPPGQSTFWGASPTFFFMRLGVVTALVPVCWALRAVMPARLGLGLASLGAASLFVYWVHVELVYGGIAVLLKRRVPLELALAGTALLCYGLAHLVPWARQWVTTPERRPAPMRRLVAKLF